MGTVKGALGIGGGVSGTGIAGPSGANLPGTVTSEQLNNADLQYQSARQAQESLLNALRAQNGIQNQSDVYAQLQGIASGQGPNPAQAQYYKNVQDLAAQQAGAISSIKGISPALAARMISQQGSAALQNAAAQGASTLAQQQLGAIGAAGNMATTQAGQQIGQVNTNAQTSLAQQQALMGALNNQNANVVGMQSNINSANAGIAGNIIGVQGKAVGGAFNAAGGAAAKAEGGEIEPPNGPRSRIGRLLSQPMADGGKVDAVVSPGEGYLPPQKLVEVLKGKKPSEVMEVFPGRPKVPGNSYANDVLPRKLEVGGVVIPNSIMQSKNPDKGAKDMVSRVVAKKKAGR